ncbi:GtrA family protein [Clostridium estertheticum]|uniref:GtrA family protein n=1 Tax=Clostridium estertheticum TaxID=238834 RepID=UPI001C7DBAE2|nr:GtrA family protein [Clostridium estertheticum]MBX4260782.1 GtrA family protein [Clostridium estertheticum]WLC70351.1 GtrA family protein [Clostridium estertheticum]
MNFFTKLNFNKEQVLKLVKQFIKFGIVGLSNTLISLATYYILIYFGINYIVANTVGFIISVLNAYYWNSKFVFKKSSKASLKPLLKTFMAYGTTFLLSTILLVVMVNYLKISNIIAPVLNLIITIPLNFVLNKFWAFK